MEPEKRKKIPPTRKNVVKIDNKGRAYISLKDYLRLQND